MISEHENKFESIIYNVLYEKEAFWRACYEVNISNEVRDIIDEQFLLLSRTITKLTEYN
jgi:hypothetical protein